MRAAHWQDAQPPATGWVEVALPDAWHTRWPDFDGVVWYRLHWTQADTAAAPALLLERLNRLGEVSLNGSLLARRAEAAGPSIQAHGLPRHWLLSAPLLRQGSNTLLVRVSGLAAYGAGLGQVWIGEPAALQAAYDRLQSRHTQTLFTLAMSLTLCGFFLALWLMRRQEAVYGWFSLMTFTWWGQILLQHMVSGPWPFDEVHAWHRTVIMLFVAQNTLFVIFILRFCDQRWRRPEAGLWLLLAAGVAWMGLAAPQHLPRLQYLLTLYACAILFGSCFVLFWRTWRTWHEGRIDLRILSLILSFSLAAGIHDLLQLLGWTGTEVQYTFYTSQIEMVGMALVLAWRFTANLRRIESFSSELAVKVAAARDELALTLRRQHELEVANARLTERHQLAHDLHDGLGGMLVSRIAAMEHVPGNVPAESFLLILKDLRDELRTTVDLTVSQQLGDQSLEALIAPLRHRITHLCESRKISCRWRTEAIAQHTMPFAQSLDLMRVLQEALTNVLKHSQASRIEIAFHDDAGALRMVVTDNGVGFDTATAGRSSGIGLRSLRQRAQRLAGELTLASRPGQTVLTLSMPKDRAPGSDPLSSKNWAGAPL